MSDQTNKTLVVKRKWMWIWKKKLEFEIESQGFGNVSEK
jgi:hypothetical protein